jgi:Peptidase propeptide and YPEB domain
MNCPILHQNGAPEEEMRFVGLTMCLVLATPAGLLAKDQRQKPKLSMDQAQKIALEKEPGKIESRELEKEHGKLIYSFDIRAADGIHEVTVDPTNGSIVEDKIETAADEAREKQQDSKKAKKKPQPPQ